jgi:hypothetical protein
MHNVHRVADAFAAFEHGAVQGERELGSRLTDSRSAFDCAFHRLLDVYGHGVPLRTGSR